LDHAKLVLKLEGLLGTPAMKVAFTRIGPECAWLPGRPF